MDSNYCNRSYSHNCNYSLDNNHCIRSYNHSLDNSCYTMDYKNSYYSNLGHNNYRPVHDHYQLPLVLILLPLKQRTKIDVNFFSLSSSPFLKTNIPFISKRLRFCFTLIVGDNTSIVKLF